MRRFIVLGHDALTTAEFSLDDLAGGAGRLDVLCRCVSAAVFLSHDVRRDVEISLVLGDEVTVRIDAADLRYMHPDERNIASLLRNALEKREELIGHVPVESTPGISVSKRGFADVLDGIGDGTTLVQLHEDGDPVVEMEPPADVAFVLSDHREFTEEEVGLLDERVDAKLRLGPEAIHANHAITVAHNFLDTEGYSRY